MLAATSHVSAQTAKTAKIALRDSVIMDTMWQKPSFNPVLRASWKNTNPTAAAGVEVPDLYKTNLGVFGVDVFGVNFGAIPCSLEPNNVCLQNNSPRLLIAGSFNSQPFLKGEEASLSLADKSVLEVGGQNVYSVDTFYTINPYSGSLQKSWNYNSRPYGTFENLAGVRGVFKPYSNTKFEAIVGALSKNGEPLRFGVFSEFTQGILKAIDVFANFKYSPGNNRKEFKEFVVGLKLK